MLPKQIMLVDDEPRVLSAIRRRLSSDFDIVTCTEGSKALEILRGDHNVGVIVADMQMPTMNGIELLVEVRKLEPKIRRLMLTGNSDQDTAMAAINDGKVFRFIRKPCDAEKLKQILIQALEDYHFTELDLEEIGKDQSSLNTFDNTRSAFLSVVSEELRTPLNQIIGLTQLLSDNEDISKLNNSGTILDSINESGEHLLSLVDRILQFTKLQSSKSVSVVVERFDIIEILRAECKRLEKTTEKKMISVSLELGQESILTEGDANEISLAIRELLANAVKFNEVNGHIGIMVKSSKDLVAIRISDTGSGMPETHKREMMDAFVQADGTLTRKHHGLGLGLGLVKVIAEKNDLYFDLNSSVDNGTVAILVCKRCNLGEFTEDRTIEEILRVS